MRKRNYCRPAVILLIGFLLIVLAGVSTVASAQSNSNQLQDERGIFDPFTLNTVKAVTAESSGDAVVSSVSLRPPIRIPVRPALRSFFRPPLVPSLL